MHAFILIWKEVFESLWSPWEQKKSCKSYRVAYLAFDRTDKETSKHAINKSHFAFQAKVWKIEYKFGETFMNKLIVGKKKKNKKISLFCKILTSSLPSGNIHLIYNYWESYQQMTFKYTTKPQGCTSSKLAVNILIYVSEKSKAFFILTDDSSL